MSMCKKRQERLYSFQIAVSIDFRDITLLNTAFVHPSVTNEGERAHLENNQRLEFLGDAVLELIVSEYLYKRYPHLTEGEMTKLRAFVVCEASLARVARKLGLGKLLLLGKGEENTQGREKASILADTFEALLGAVYIDKGLKASRKFVLVNLRPTIDEALNGELIGDYKTRLQETLQKADGGEISYNVVKETGPDHDKKFYVEVVADNKILGHGAGKSKKQAEQNAAKEALKIMKHPKI